MVVSGMTRIAAFVISLLLPVAAMAQDVTLLSRDGAIEISGNFLSFDGEFYRVDTDLGILTVDSSGVRCEGPGCPDLEGYFAQIRLSGEASATESLLPALITAFALRNGYSTDEAITPDGRKLMRLQDTDADLTVAEFVLSETSSAEGFADLLAENADIVVSLRRVTREERALAQEAGLGDLHDPFRARVIALDALVPIVSRSNRLEALSLEALGGLFDGSVTNWSEIGGQDAPVVAHLVRDDMLAASAFAQMVLHEGVAEQVVTHDSYGDLIAAVEADPYAVGMARLSGGGSVRTLGLTGACGFAAEVSSSDIKTEDYPLTRSVLLYTPARRLPALARDFLHFVVSPAAQMVVARTPFVDQGVDELSFRDQGQRFANAISRAGPEITLADLQAVTTAFQGARRLTLGFRFEGGSVRLDAQSRSNVLLLAELLEAGVYDGKTLIFSGFSDSHGSPAVNRGLSERRAQAVLAAVRKALGEAFEADRVTLTSAGFGEAMPLACDDVAWGRSLNRRVEVWVRDQR
ncbi:phosphate ABC transporter substrate-binding/OmpA family protein [Celeribacter indicus]|uniref:OmpA/MotB protein n=1 Tax=Celeribacter indicus TaxID=1208324 RepID=A0A0B5DUS4_9RHOB|nr:phosphate ABC transporter substrate-binding/OmpA family protein [Celeribacter indicus]AJE44980.1 OmpA/MotB protein [Celeribacter indicus]SDW95606.1 phosphate ABC transporter substrate-binding protein, PhoT family [Celeribacter indicus]